VERLPGDGHVHSEWSWDTVTGSMLESCARAVDLGLPSIAFTEHADLTPWRVPAEFAPTLPDRIRVHLGADHVLAPPALDVDGYLDCVAACRDRFPGLRIRTGIELGEPHWHPDAVRALLAGGRFDRVLGSVHSLRTADGDVMVDLGYAARPAAEVVRGYLAVALALVRECTDFAVLAHVDYAIRAWPAAAGPFDVHAFEDEFRAVLVALAGQDRALEVNTRLPLPPVLLRWWAESGGGAVSFGSDAHDPAKVGHGFAGAAALAESCGFRPQADPGEFWTRRNRIG
jgi:histidinol-phosphatase (PHP family)